MEVFMDLKYPHSQLGKASARISRASHCTKILETSQIFTYAIFSDFGSRLLRENIVGWDGLELGIKKENAIIS